jgi:hypothetical protein
LLFSKYTLPAKMGSAAKAAVYRSLPWMPKPDRGLVFKTKDRTVATASTAPCTQQCAKDKVVVALQKSSSMCSIRAVGTRGFNTAFVAVTYV